jgi:Cache 3/Cache 2 fusion domain
LPLAISCTTTMVVTPSSIRNDMAAIKRDINSNRSAMNGLKNKRVGSTGFYYIVDNDGKVVFHPREALIGTSFKNHWFIDKIINDRSGCLTYQLGNRTHVVYFEQLDDSDILCLSIVSDDIRQGIPDCQQVEIK